MLIAIYLFLTGGGSSFVTLDFIEEKEDLVAVVVVDEARKKNSLGILKQMTSRAEVFKKQRGALMKRTKKLINENADVHAIGIQRSHAVHCCSIP